MLDCIALYFLLAPKRKHGGASKTVKRNFGGALDTSGGFGNLGGFGRGNDTGRGGFGERASGSGRGNATERGDFGERGSGEDSGIGGFGGEFRGGRGGRFVGRMDAGGFGGGPTLNFDNVGNEGGEQDSTQTQITIPNVMAGANIGPVGRRIGKIRNDSMAGITKNETAPGSNEKGYYYHRDTETDPGYTVFTGDLSE